MPTARGARLLTTLDLATHDYSPELMIKVPSQAASALELAKNTLQTLNLHMCHGFWSKPENAPTFRCLRTLRLTQSHLNAVELRALLSCCTAGLTSFTYEAAQSCSGFDGSQFHPWEAVEYLSPHRRTLQALHLDLRQVVEDLSMQPILPGSLVDFNALEDLFLSVNTLWTKAQASPAGEAEGARLLPRLLPASMKSLRITIPELDRRVRLLPVVLLGLARAVVDEEKLTGLRQVRCDSRIKRRLSKGLGPEIGSIFHGAGVGFGFDSWPVSPTTVALEDMPLPLRRGRDAFLLDDFDFDEWEIEEAERMEDECGS